jgi:hypothetical protein
MSANERLMWAGVIVIFELVVFFLPLMAILSAYVILVRPVWFKNWIDRIYASGN